MSQQQSKIEEHNHHQRDYYEHRTVRQNWRMVPTGNASVAPYIANHLERLIAFGGLDDQQSILDIGCGMGKYTIPLARKGFNIEALDLSPVLLNTLESHCDADLRIATHCIDILDPPASFTKRYDIIMGSFMLHHLLDPGTAFKKINQFLNPTGKLLFIDVNPFCPLYYLQITLAPSMSWKAEKGILNLTPEKITRNLKNAGFTNINIEKFGISPPPIRNRFFGEAVDNIFDAIPFLNSLAAFQLISAEVS